MTKEKTDSLISEEINFTQAKELLAKGAFVRRKFWYPTHYLHMHNKDIFKNENGTDGFMLFTPNDEQATDYEVYKR
jgi:hypothetical protein